jgi:hypothetical protein
MAGRIGVQGGSANNLLYISDAGSARPDHFYISGVAVQDPSPGLFVSYAAGAGGSFRRGVDVVGGSGGSPSPATSALDAVSSSRSRDVMSFSGSGSACRIL